MVDVLFALKGERFLGSGSILPDISTGDYGAPRRKNVFCRIPVGIENIVATDAIKVSLRSSILGACEAAV